MKRTLPLLLLLLGSLGSGHAQIADSAQWVVESYFQRLNFNALPPDSILYIESRIVISGQSDTLLMKRWHMAPNLDRMEMWAGDELMMGFCGNGGTTHHQYSPKYKRWRQLTLESYLDLQQPYDFRGSLYNYQANAIDLTYQGITQFQGQECYKIKYSGPNRYNRIYLFEKATSLFFFFSELNSGQEHYENPETHVDWRATMEYTPVGEALLPSKDCYQKGNTITYSLHTYSLLPADKNLFRIKQ